MNLKNAYDKGKNIAISRFLSLYYQTASAVNPLVNDGKTNIVVSLTSFTPRLDKLYIALGSIFNQSLQPDKIVLYLGSDVDKEHLPDSLTRFCNYGLELRFVENIKSHKKYYYAFQEFPDSLIITVDDDLIYHKNMVKKLYQTHQKFPECVCAMRTHEILYNEDGIPQAYDAWVKNSKRYEKPSTDLFFTSGAGTLYSPIFFSKEVYNLDNIRQFCFSADDVWLNCMCRLNNIKTVNVSLTSSERQLLRVLGTQDVALKYQNLYDSGNDVCIQNMITQYGRQAFCCRKM